MQVWFEDICVFCISAPNANADSATKATSVIKMIRVLFLIKSPTIMIGDTIKKFVFLKEVQYAN